MAPTARPRTGGDTLEDPAYLAWVLDLQSRGIEIAYHGATDHSSTRDRTLESLNRFKANLGYDPYVYTEHTGQREAMYWGAARLEGLPRVIYQGLNALGCRDVHFYGEDQASPYFWGDLCLERVAYMRGFTVKDINTLNFDPQMPYHDPRRPYVRYWFSSSDGGSVEEYLRLLQPRNQDRLREEGGACIVYAHLGRGFVRKGRLNPEFKRLMERLSSLPGWFTPVGPLLDHLRSRPGWTAELSGRGQIRRMQWKWLLQNLHPSRWAVLLKRVVRRAQQQV